MADGIWNMGKLGFGLMRLPRKGLRIDIDRVKDMVDLFMTAGFTYFDTAFVYPGSETATKKALVSRYPRESFQLATKVNALLTAPTAKAVRKQFETSLRRTGAGYFDCYLLHMLMGGTHRLYDRYRLWDFGLEQRERGLVRRFGFSFHGGPKLLDRLLDDHPEVDFVQLQINYMDWESPLVHARANYEVARSHGVPIIVMEPVKGGILADPPEEAVRLMRECRPELSPASWAIRFAASLPGVLTVLSGMSSEEQMRDNLSYMGNFRPLDAEEQDVIRKVRGIVGRSDAIPCTACRYCVGGCPRNIPIPEIFAATNTRTGSGQALEAATAYEEAIGARGAGAASDCIGCGQCERACPQHLPVTEYLSKCSELFGR